MKIRLATSAWNGAKAAETYEDTEIGVRFPWVEIDGVRHTDVVAGRVEVDNGNTFVSITFLAAVEMVLLGPDGHILAGTTVPDEVIQRDGSGKVLASAQCEYVGEEIGGLFARCDSLADHPGDHAAWINGERVKWRNRRG